MKTGEKYFTSEGYEIQIIEYINNRNCTILFSDDTKLSGLSYDAIKRGNIKNPYHKSLFNIGYNGVGVYKCTFNSKSTKCYTSWRHMLERCYNEKYHIKKPTYKGCSVDKEWHNFQNFAKWYEENYQEGFHLDKDILIKGNKIYSPETCCFVPNEINILFNKRDSKRGDYPIGVNLNKASGKFISQLSSNKNFKRNLGSYNTSEEAFNAYKIAKEAYIKQMAEKNKGQIIKKCYEALYNYKVEFYD